jgi:plastocyanin
MIARPHDRTHYSRRLVRTLLLSTTVIALAAGCAAGSADVPVEGTQVRVVDNDFEPSVLHVTTGETVTWTWEGSRDHNVVGEAFQSETQASGTFTHTFAQPGTYPYQCALHAGMRGEIIVTTDLEP